MTPMRAASASPHPAGSPRPKKMEPPESPLVKLVDVCLALTDPAQFQAIFRPLVDVMLPKDPSDASPALRSLCSYLIKAPEGRLYEKDWESVADSSITALVQASPKLLDHSWEVMDASVSQLDATSEGPPGSALKLWLKLYLKKHDDLGKDVVSAYEAERLQVSTGILRCLRSVFDFEEQRSIRLVKLFAKIRANPAMAKDEFVDKVVEALSAKGKPTVEEDAIVPVSYRATTRPAMLDNLKSEDSSVYWESRGHPDSITVVKPAGYLLNHLKIKTHPYSHGYEPKDVEVRLATSSNHSLRGPIITRNLPKAAGWVSLFDRQRDMSEHQESLQDLLQELDITVTFLLNWDGGANTKVNCIRAYGFEPVDLGSMSVPDRLRVSMPLVVIEQAVTTLHRAIQDRAREPDPRCCVALVQLGKLQLYRAQIVGLWTRLLEERGRALEAEAAARDGAEEDVLQQLEGMSSILACTEIERKFAGDAGLDMLFPVIDKQAATLWRQKLEKDRLVERFLADSSEPVDSVLCITIRRILGIVISSTPREEELLRVKKVWSEGVMEAVLKILMQHLSPRPSLPVVEAPQALLRDLQQLSTRLNLLYTTHDGRFSAHLAYETSQGYAAAWKRLSRGAAAQLADLLAAYLDQCADPLTGGRASVGGASAVKQVSLACGPFQLDCLQDVAWFHERYLARRLLKQRTLGPAAEESLLLEAGWDRHRLSNSRFQHMLNDLRWTDEVLRDMFQRDLAQGMRDQLLCTSSPLFSQEFGVVIASPGHWPTGMIEAGPLTLPPTIAKALDDLNLLYRRQVIRTAPAGAKGASASLETTYPGKRLLPFPRAGSVELTCSFQTPGQQEGQVDMLASPTQAMALLALAQQPATSFSLKELALAIGYEPSCQEDLDKLRRELLPLTSSRHPLLRRRAPAASPLFQPRQGSSSRAVELWQLNTTFAKDAPESLLSFRGCYALPERRQEDNVYSERFAQLAVSKAFAWRHELIAAACARVAKRVVHCVGYDSFVDLVRAELAGRLEPSRDDIVSAIDSLMRHDILTLVSVEEEAATVLPEGAAKAANQLVAVKYCAEPAPPAHTTTAAAPPPLALFTEATDASSVLLSELGLVEADLASGEAFRDAAVRVGGRRGMVLQTSRRPEGEREKTQGEIESLRKRIESLTEELNNLEVAKVMVEMDRNQARGLETMQEGIRNNINELQASLDRLAAAADPGVRLLSSFETSVGELLGGLVSVLRKSAALWLSTVRDALKREKTGGVVVVPPPESWAQDPPQEEAKVSSWALRLLLTTPRYKRKLQRLHELLSAAEKDAEQGQGLVNAITAASADHSRNKLLRLLLQDLFAASYASLSTDDFLSRCLGPALLRLTHTTKREESRGVPVSVAHVVRGVRERLVAEVDQAVASAEMHLGMMRKDLLHQQHAAAPDRPGSASPARTLVRGETWAPPEELLGLQGQPVVEKLLGQLREVVGEKKEQDRRGRQFEEQTREEAACMSLHQHRHRHRGLFVSLDLTAEDDGTADITAQAATAEHHEEEQPMEELQQAVLDRATSLTRVVSGGKSIMQKAWALDSAESAMAESSRELQDIIAAVGEMFALESGSSAHLLCARNFNVTDVVEDLLEDREETLSRAHLPRDGAACYVFREARATASGACMLCCDDQPQDVLVAVRRCGHVLCKDCLRNHARARIESNPGGTVTCPLCPVKSASALTLTMLKALGQGDHTAVVLTGIKKVVGEEPIAVARAELHDALLRLNFHPLEVVVAESVVPVDVEQFDEVLHKTVRHAKDMPGLQGYAVVELRSEAEALELYRLANCSSTGERKAPCLSVCGVALRAVLGGWVAVQERAVFKWFGDGRNLPCRASKDCPGIVQVATGFGLRQSGGSSNSEGGCLPLKCRLCDATFCSSRQCARRSHAPATCLMMEKWEAVGGIYPDMDSSKANEVLIKVDSKPCPRCHIPVHRIQGCNQMTCTCMAKFCYMCGSDWDRRHEAAGHFACPAPRDVTLRDSGNFQELAKEATKRLEVVEERRIDAKKLRDQAFQSVAPSVASLERVVRLRLLHADLHHSLMDVELVLFGACVLSHYIPASGFGKARHTVQALQARLVNSSVREAVQAAVTDLKEIERGEGTAADIQRKLLAYLSGEREASLRRSVAVLQRMLQLFVEETHLIARMLTLEAQRAADDAGGARGSAAATAAGGIGGAHAPMQGTGVGEDGELTLLPLLWDVADIASESGLTVHTPGDEDVAQEEAEDNDDDDTLGTLELHVFGGDGGY